MHCVTHSELSREKIVAPSGYELSWEKKMQILKLLLSSDTFPLCSPFIGQSKSCDMTNFSHVGRKCILHRAGRRIEISVSGPKASHHCES